MILSHAVMNLQNKGITQREYLFNQAHLKTQRYHPLPTPYIHPIFSLAATPPTLIQTTLYRASLILDTFDLWTLMLKLFNYLFCVLIPPEKIAKQKKTRIKPLPEGNEWAIKVCIKVKYCHQRIEGGPALLLTSISAVSCFWGTPYPLRSQAIAWFARCADTSFSNLNKYKSWASMCLPCLAAQAGCQLNSQSQRMTNKVVANSWTVTALKSRQ